MKTAILVLLNLLSSNVDAGAEAAPVRYALVGDSHVSNVGPELRNSIANASPRFTFTFTFGVGTRAVNWTDTPKLKNWLLQFDPDIVLVCFGTNEASSYRSIDLLAGQFRDFVNAVSDNGRRRVVWIAPPKLAGVNHLKNVREALKRIRKEKQIEVLDLSDEDYTPTEKGVHLTPAAYRIWAWDIWKALRAK